MARRAALTSVVVVACLAGGGCTGESNDPAAEPGPDAASGPAAPSSPPSSPPAEPEKESQPELVVVTHATVPQLDVRPGVVRRLGSGQVRRWRGFRVVSGAPPGQAVAAVEGDPGTLAVVPVEAVGPTVVAARVGGRDPIRGRAKATDVTVVGDLMLVRGVPAAGAALAPTSRRLRGADLTVGNLESTLSTDGAPTQGGDSFGAGPELIRPLARSGLDALSLANNHAGDYGTPALLDTVRELRESPIVPFGAGRDDRAAAEPAVLEAGGTTYAFLGFNAIGETLRAEPGQPGALSVRMPPRTGPLVPADLDRVVDAVQRAKRTADVVVVLPHWGEQYTHRPKPVQRLASRRLVAAGADLVVGGHPHWVQGLDHVRGVPVVHSLGNFVFDMDFSQQTMEGVVLETTWWGSGAEAELKALRLVPYRMEDGSFAPRMVDGTVGAGILDDVWGSSTGPYAD